MQSTTSRCVLLWLTCIIMYGYFSTVLNDNVQTRVALTLSLVEHHTVDINSQANFTADKAFLDGNYYSDKAPELSLLAVPSAQVVTKLLDRDGTGAAWVATGALTQRYAVLVSLLTLSTVSLLASCSAVATYRWNLRYGSSHGGALFAAATLGFATPFFGWATLFFGHVASGAMLLLGFIALSQASETAPSARSPLLALAAGLALGAAFCIEFPAGPAVAIIGISCAAVALATADRWTRVRRVFVSATVGLILAIAPLPIYNEAAFHSPFRLGYESVQDFPGMQQGFFGVRLPDPSIAWELVGGTFRGLLAFSPMLILFPIALVVAFRNKPHRLAAFVALGVFAYYLAMNAGYFYWDGGSSTGPRHLVPALPFMTLLLGRLWDVSRPALRTLFLVLFGISAAISLVCASVDMLAPPSYPHPLTDYLLPAFMTGHLHRLVAGRLLPDVNGLLLLEPLLVVWLVAWRLLVFGQQRTGAAPSA